MPLTTLTVPLTLRASPLLNPTRSESLPTSRLRLVKFNVPVPASPSSTVRDTSATPTWKANCDRVPPAPTALAVPPLLIHGVSDAGGT